MHEFFSNIDNLLSPLLGIALVALVYFTNRSVRRRRERRQAQAIAAGQPAPPVKRPLPWRRGLITGAVLAAVYLLVFRGLSFLSPYDNDNRGGGVLMSFAFLFLGPLMAGCVTVVQDPGDQPWSVNASLLAPWIPILVNIILALSIRWEGIICAVFIVPPALLSASLGGLLINTVHRHLYNKHARKTVYCLAVLPLLLAMVEEKIHQPLETRSVNTEIRIHAPASVVWQNIGRVPPISRSELRRSWANIIGFPRPIEATMSYEGVGAVRHGIFERGLTFNETVTAWDPDRRYAFTIRADTAHIPLTTLDEHVTVGGRFFDVLDGEYIVEPLPNGDVLLHLNSRERLSTDFNLYAAMWSDAVMRDVQSNILYVIKNRCEVQSSAANLLH